MIVYYHGGCPDGWVAAYIVKKRYPDAELIPLSYGEVDLDRMTLEVEGKNVIMVDFALKTRMAHDQLAASASNLLVLDHHKTAKAVLEGASNTVFDMNRSGAALAWDYMFGRDAGVMDFTGERPWWVQYTQDQDLWRFELRSSRAINGWLNIQERTVENWDYLTATETPTSVERLGGAVQQFTQYMVKAAMKDLQEGKWLYEGREYSVGLVNNGHVGTSEVGEAVYSTGYDIAVMWREDGRGVIRFGLRSTTVDVGAIASLYEGGGGHKNASGFELGVEAGRELIDWLLGRVIYVPPRCA